MAKLHDIFASAGWSVEELDKDYGEDILVRLFYNSNATPYTFYVQAKASDNVSKSITADSKWLKLKIEAGHVQHWADFWEPVIITLWDSTTNQFFWEVAQEPERLPTTAEKFMTFYMPVDNKFDEEGMKRLATKTIRRHHRFELERQGADILIERLRELLGIKIDYDPQNGILLVEMSDGGQQATLWGKHADLIKIVAKRHGIAIDEAFNKAIIKGYKIFEALNSGGSLVITDKAGEEVHRWESNDELRRHIQRSDELGSDWP